MNFGQSWKTVLIQFSGKRRFILPYSESRQKLTSFLPLEALLTFYVQTWEEYHTKSLILGIVSGPVEGILTLCLVYVLTAYQGGGSFWERSMLQTIGVKKTNLLPDLVYDLAWNEWYLAYGGVMLVFNTIQR
jgi:ethanolaminephosphotransferase